MELSFGALCARLRLAPFRAYLIERGWRPTEAEGLDRLRFELPDGDAPYYVLLPSSDDDPTRASVMQRALYHLCEVEDRQPREIAADVLATEAPATPTPRSANGGARLRVENERGAPLDVFRPGIGGPTRLLPGEALELLFDAAGGPIAIRLGESSVAVGFRDPPAVP
ncbi:MAG: hypothetical protein ACRCT8_03815 [Lacipirellulaceae bacterium]